MVNIFLYRSPSESKLYKLAFGFALFSIFYNVLEGIVSTWLGFEGGTLSLFGFGIDSFIEVISGIGIAHMILAIRHHQQSDHDEFEKTALKITGWSFYILVVGLVITSLYNIYIGHKPQTTFWGIIISLISIAVMWLLAYGKTKAGTLLHSNAILADAGCTKVCIYMSVILLLSSLIFELTAFKYIDSIGTLGLAYFAYKEGKECFEKAKGATDACCKH